MHFSRQKLRLFAIWIGVFLSFSQLLIAQNLVVNGDFEDVNICPEFHSPCSPEAWKDVFMGSMAYVCTRSKGNKIGFSVQVPNTMCSTVIPYTELLCTLDSGQIYRLNFDLYLRDIEFVPFPIRFSRACLQGKFDSIQTETQVHFSSTHCRKKIKMNDWLPFEALFTAYGGEKFLYVGDIASKYSGSLGGNNLFYIDNIVLQPEHRGGRHDCNNVEETKKRLYRDNFRHQLFLDSLPAPAPVDTTTWESEPEPPLDTLPVEVRRDTAVLSGICFDFDKSNLSSQFIAVADSLADWAIARHPSRVLVQGFTDTIGDDAYNQVLSEARAETMRQLLIAKGLNPESVVAEGFGKLRPVQSNDTEAGRMANRRVELVLFYTE